MKTKGLWIAEIVEAISKELESENTFENLAADH